MNIYYNGRIYLDYEEPFMLRDVLYLQRCTSHELRGSHHFKDWDVVVFGKDYELGEEPGEIYFVAMGQQGKENGVRLPCKDAYDLYSYLRVKELLPAMDADKKRLLCEAIEAYASQPSPVTGDAKKTVGQLITEAIVLQELNPVVVEQELKLPKGILTKLMNDEFYTNSIPVVLFKDIILSLHIPFSKIEPAMLPTFKILVSKETSESLKKKPQGFMLWENEESLVKYTNQLKEIMQPVTGDVEGALKDEIKYWKTRCHLAENCLKESPCDPDVTEKQIQAHKEYKIIYRFT